MSKKPLPENVKFAGKKKSRNGIERPFYSVTCLFCGGKRDISQHHHALHFANRRCKSCSNKNNNPQNETFGLRRTWFNKIKISAELRSLDYELDAEFVANLLETQKYQCALSGLPITASGDLKDISASIDRIDNSLGYVKENIQIVHKKINIMRGSLTVQEFKDFCKAVADNQIC